MDEFGRVLETLKTDVPKKAVLAEMAVRQYGGMEKFTDAMKENFKKFPEIVEQVAALKGEVNGNIDQTKELMGRLTAALNREPSSKDAENRWGTGDCRRGVYGGDQLDQNYWGDDGRQLFIRSRDS